MALEDASYISQLTATNPTTSDTVAQGDDHLRMLKTVLKTQFSGLSGTTAVTASEAEMNYLDIATLGTSADSKVLTQASGVVTIAGDVVVSGTTPKVTIGDAGAEDAMLAFDGNALDFHIALDDTGDDLVIGTGTTAGTATLILVNGDGSETKFNQPKITLGDGTAEDTYLVIDGNAVDYRIGLDDGTDKLEIGAGSAHGTTTAIAVDSAADMIIGGYINFQDEQAIRPEIKDYAETVNAIGGTGGGTQDIDVTAGNVVTATVDSSTNTFTFSNPSANGKACSFTLILTNGGSQTVNWPGSVDWAGGSAPSLTSSGVDILTFTTVDAGTIWYGFAAGTDMK
jgi:hypothetical protein